MFHMPSFSHYTIPEVISALNAQCYAKLILGASFRDTLLIEHLCRAYARSGVQVIDMAADSQVLETVLRSFESIAEETGSREDFPALMISLDVDGDPHFRHIVLDEPACIDCGACVPVCPTEVFSLSVAEHVPTSSLHMVSSRCYGCNQCIPVCPTEALSLQPVAQPSSMLTTLLAYPAIQLVELHTEHLDLSALQEMLHVLGPGLKNKLLSLCWRPVSEEALLTEKQQEAQYLHTFDHWVKTYNDYGVWMVQIDGIPMGGAGYREVHAERVQTSQERLAWYAALSVATRYQWAAPSQALWQWLTLSGGVTPETALFYKASPQNTVLTVHGAGMGSIAKKLIQPALQADCSPTLKQHLYHKAISAIKPFLIS
jgi:ferredoxin